MAHHLEMNADGTANMCFVNETPWHRLGKQVSDDLTPEQFMKEAGLDWKVELRPTFYVEGDDVKATGRSALVRTSDGKMLDVVSDDWNPVQNDEAFEFFREYVMAGDMTMETAGSLKGGQIVWGLAKVKESFELFKGDVIQSYLLFSNFHRYGCSTDIRFTPIRVVCNNTLTLSLSNSVERMTKISHRKQFDASDVKDILGIATDKLQKYKEMAQFLGDHRFTTDKQMEYFGKVFGFKTDEDGNILELSRNARQALELVDTQPGHEYAEGTYWQLFNAVTYMADHKLGRTADNRLTSSWYGQNKTLKNKALELAVEMAETA